LVSGTVVAVVGNSKVYRGYLEEKCVCVGKKSKEGGGRDFWSKELTI